MTLSLSLLRLSLPPLALLAGVCALLAGCNPSGESGVRGTLLYGDRPLAGAQLEVYLKGEKDRATAPFAVATTDASGGYRLELPPGRYYLIGRKRIDGEGGSRMLMADSPANPVEVRAGMTPVAPFSLREMGLEGRLVPEPETGVSGRVVHAGAAVPGAWVYVYTDASLGLMGPSYGAAAQADEEGRFVLPLPAGTFYLGARLRADGGRLGDLSAGDLNGAYPGNPVRLARGESLELGAFPLERVDAERRESRRAEGTFQATDTLLAGRVVDGDGRPVPRVTVFAYRDSRMVGKPSVISDPTGADGSFRLFLPVAGTWFVGARSALGGPLEPGEWIGTWDGRPDHGVEVAAGERRDLGVLTVREVW